MALDPLKFRIAIERRELDKELKEAKTTIQNGLTDVPITIKIANLDAIKKQLESLEVKVTASGTSSHKSGLASLKESVAEVVKLLEIQNKVQDAMAKMKGLASGGKLVAGFEDAKKQLEEFHKKLGSVSGAEGIKAVAKEWATLGVTINKVIKDQEAANKLDSGLAKKYAASLDNAKKVLADIDNLLGRLKSSAAKADGLHINTEAIQKQIAALKAFREEVEKIKDGTKKVVGFKATPSGDLAAQMKYAKEELRQLDKEITKTEKDNERAAKAAEKNAAAMQKAAQSAQQLSSEEQRLAQAIQHSISQMNHQSQVLTDLKSMAMQYLSVYAGQQFLNNIIEIGGQLEMQRLSIGAILQDTAHANDLFDRIKVLALQSPFGVVELDQFTKQLSAYGFKYNELFDMTKRLADISAGAGTDVSRLALALGHVRSEGALTGYTLRQFAMNNIPMLGKLSEKLSELEGHTVTAGEVRKRVSKKQIDYDMVESVIKDLTNEGGMFYNMQEVISGSVKAKWKNLRDAFDIMYGEMAESAVGGGLKDVATTLTAMAKRWKELGSVVLSVATVFGGMKALMFAYNTLLGQQTRAVFAGIAAQRQARVSLLQLESSYRTLTATEQGYVLTSTKVSLADKARMVFNTRSAAFIRERIALTYQARMNEISMALSTRQLTAAELARAVALGKVNKNAAILAIGNARLDEIQRRQMQATVASVRTYGMFTGVVNGTAMAFTRLGMAMKAILLNPMTWVFAAVAVITDLWQRNNQEMERAKELAKSLAERSTEGIKNTQMMMRETGMDYTKGGKSATFGQDIGGTFTHAPASEMSGDAMLQTMEKWTTYIKEYSSMKNTLLQDAMMDGDKMRDIPDQYERLAKAVESVAEAQLKLKQIADGTDFVLGSTNRGWLDDDLVTNMNDYAKAVKKSDTAISKFAMSNKGAMVAALNAARADEAFAAGLQSANETMQEKEGRNLTEEEQLRMLASSTDLYAEAIRNAEQAIGNLGDKSGMKAFSNILSAIGGEQGAQNTMSADMDIAADSIRQLVKEKWHKDIKDITDSEKQALLQMVSDIALKSGESTETIRNKIMELFAEKLGIELDINEVDIANRVSLLQQDLEKLVGHDWHIDIRTTTNFSDLITKIRQEYKSAQDYFNNVKPLMVKMGINVAGGMKQLTPEQRQSIISRWMAANPTGNQETIKMALDQWDAMALAMQDAMDFSKATGISLTDPNPGGKVFRDSKKKNKKDKKESKEDKEAKAWKERIRLLKDARSWYDKWEKEVGHSAALEKVQEMFKKLVTKKDIENLEAYRKSLQAVINMAQARKNRNKGKDEHADEVIRQGEEAIQQIDLMIFQREGDKFTSGMKKEIDDLTRRWEIYNNVLETTGNRMLAMRLAGFGKNDMSFNARSSADALRNTLDAAMILPGLEKTIDFGRVAKMSDKDIENYVKEELFAGTDKYKDKIEGIIDSLKDWKKLNRDIVRQDLQNYAQLIGQAQDYWSLIQKNNAEYEEKVKGLANLLGLGTIGLSEYIAGENMARTERDDKNSKLSANYLNLMNNANALSRGEVLDAIDNAVMHLNERMAAGIITTEEYVNELKKLDSIKSEWESNGFFGEKGAFGSFLTGGNQGLIKYYAGQESKYTAQAAEARQKYGEFSPEAQDAVKNADKYAKLRQALEKLTDNAEDVVKVLEGLQQGIDLVTNMFDALGMEGAATAVGDAGGILSGALGGASALSAFGPWGMAAGAALGGITSIAQLHDKKKELLIEEIKEEVQQIDNTLNLIRTGREKTLGYDTGYYRRMMAAKYDRSNLVDIFGIPMQNPMYEYYTRGGLDGSGYTQELEALKKQREDYETMFNAENSKKKSSSAALEEYKQKMAELDSQIYSYTENLAKELWSIDLKGWADQIGDALMNAFENGTSAAKAFDEAVSGIMRNVVNQMLNVGFLQPMMEKLRTRLFGENGAFDYSNPEQSMGQVLAELGKFFGEGGEGQAMILASQEFLSGAEEMLKNNFGLTLKSGSQSTQTSGIQSQATEETIGILSGQMARIAQDVSVKRIFVTQLVTEQMPKMLENAQMQRTLLENQFQSVRAIEHMMADGDGALFASIDRMSRKVDRAITPEGRMRVE